jgi:hypothetical protein
MAEMRIAETEQARRERIRRMQRRRELRLRRKRRKQMIRLAKLGAAGVAVILGIVVISSVVTKVKKATVQSRDRKAAAAMENTQLYTAEEVLHLNFPVLTLDHDRKEPVDLDGDGQPDEDLNQNGIPDVTEGFHVTDSVESTSENGILKNIPTLTVSEFNDILQDLYNRNYVLVDIHDIAKKGGDGFSAAKVAVPEGKLPLILSESGLAYDASDNQHARNMYIDDSGKCVNTYVNENGQTVAGAADVVTCVDAFVEQHPDFSCGGARGIIGLTGSEGIFGYKISEEPDVVSVINPESVPDGTVISADDAAVPETSENGGESVTASSHEAAGTAAGADLDASRADAKKAFAQSREKTDKIVKVLRKEGWVFACATYADISYASELSIVKKDADLWHKEVGSLLGETDVQILPHGGDLDGRSGYRSENEKYAYLKKLGFSYYCVDNSGERTWVQTTSDYVRQGMHEIHNKEAYGEVMAMS